MPPAAARVGVPQDTDWDLIVRRIRSGRCVPFLGAAASLGSAGRPGLPTGAQLARHLARLCKYPGPDDGDLLRVGQYFQMVFDAHDLREAIVERLAENAPEPGPVHHAIAALPVPLVLTTNFDDLMERAFVAGGKHPTAAVYDLRGDVEELAFTPTVEAPLVYKLHGTAAAPATLIATEDDIIEFLTALLLRSPGLPRLITDVFTSKSVLFIGYGLKDWNIRVMLRALRPARFGGRRDLASFAVQRRPEDHGLAAEWEQAVIYWEQNESLRCFDMDASAFAAELKVRFGA